MANWLVTRHKAATLFARHLEIEFTHIVTHLQPDNMPSKGDAVYGVLPVNVAAQVCEIGAAYYHLCMLVPEHYRGQELSLEQMQAFGASFERYQISKS